MVSADGSLSSAMEDGASERSLEGRDMMKKEEEVGLNGCFKRKGPSGGRCSAIGGEVVFVVWFGGWLILLIGLIL